MTKSERAGFPEAGRCMVCHQSVKRDSPAIQALASLPKDAKPFGKRPVYRLPDFVFFSHARHVAAKVECATCHGTVWEQDRILKPAVPLNMKMCVACHREQQATVACNACHELNQ